MNASERIDSIIEWRNRRGTNSTTTVVGDLGQLRILWQTQKSALIDTADFFPIRMVTLLEVFVRDWVIALVNHGVPYVERAEKLCKDAKFGFVFSLALQSKKVSLGELVAHSISTNSINQILNVFEQLVGPDFKSSIKRVSDRVAVEILGLPDDPIIADFNATAAWLEKLLTVRHILVHEHPQKAPYALDDIESFLASCIEFTSAVEEELSFRIYGKTPLTQSEMNIDAASSLDSSEAELRSVVNTLVQGKLVPLDLYNETEAAWTRFRDLAARLQSSVVEGGSMQSMVFAMEKEDLTRDWIRRLQHYKALVEGDVDQS